MSTTPIAYRSAYPGSMFQRLDGDYIERTDAKSLAAALVELVEEKTRAVDDVTEAQARNDLAAAARRLEISANTVAYCYEKHPRNFASALQQLQDDATAMRAELAKVGAP
jgi:hypothetical protein